MNLEQILQLLEESIEESDWDKVKESISKLQDFIWDNDGDESTLFDEY
tara:strand:- start:452 stop:595 length:144 start_codon:yes stop_codon:yes gene_type:complete